VVERDREFGVRAALPEEFKARVVLLAVDGEDNVLEQAAQELVAVSVGGRGRLSDAGEIGGEARERLSLLVAEGRGAAAFELAGNALLSVEFGQRGFERVLEGAGDEPMLGFAGVVLAARAFGLVGGAFDGEALQRDALVVRGLQGSESAGGGVDASRSDGIQERLRDGAVDAQRADRLARPTRALLLERA
jgi:hypothetical protein